MRNSVNTQTNEEPDQEVKDDNLPEEAPFHMVKRTLTEKAVITLNDSVVSMFAYRDLLNFLDDLPPKIAEIDLKLMSWGGIVQGGVPLFNAFKDTGVPVNVICVGECYSMGAILALCGTSLTLKSGAKLMFHNYSGFTGGKGKELADKVRNTQAHMKKWDLENLQPFLTVQEINSINEDQDLYINWYDKDLKTRIKRHFKGKA